MAHGDGKIEIKVDIISDPNAKGKVKHTIDELERDVIASQKRIEASHKATNKAIDASEKANTRSARMQAKERADNLIREIKRTENEVKRSSTSMQAYLRTAFGGGLIGGAIGGFAGSIVGAFSSQVAQLPSILKTQIDEMVRIAAERQNAFKGLQTMSQFLGISSRETETATRNLRLVRSGVVDITDATTSLKNLLSSGFSLPESVKLLEAFSDTAAFGKSAALGFGEAIRGATEGIRNGNSILVDNVGLTKNLSIILKEAGFEEKDLMRVKDDHAVRQALLNGLLKEALPQMGDADKLTKGWTGSTAALSTAQQNLYATVGDVIINNKHLIATIQTSTGKVNELTGAIKTNENGWKTWADNIVTWVTTKADAVHLSFVKEIADANELELAIRRLGATLGWWMTLWDTNGFGGPGPLGLNEKYTEILKSLPERGTYYKQAEQYSRSYNDSINRKVVEQMGLTPGYNPLFQKPSQPFTFKKPSTAVDNISIDPKTGLFVLKTPAGSIPSGSTGSGGRGRVRTAANTDSRRLDDIIEFVREQGFTVTSGYRSGGTTGIHATGRAADVRVQGKTADEIGQFIALAIEKGYRVVDERTKIPGSPFWSGPHLHLESNNRRESSLFDKNSYGSIPVGLLRQMDSRRFSKGKVTNEEINKYLTENALTAGDTGISSHIDLSKMEREVELGEKLIGTYEDLIRAIAGMNEMSREETFLLDVKLGKYSHLTSEQVDNAAATYRMIDAAEKKKVADEQMARAAEDYANEQQRLFEETSNRWHDLLSDLSRGDFRSIWERLKNDMLEAFIRPLSQSLAQFSAGAGSALSNLFGGFGGMKPSLAGGGSMGPGGTPMFNPTAGGGGVGGFIGNFFGGGSGSGSGFGGFSLGGLFGRRGGSGTATVPVGGGSITIPGGIGGGGGFGGFLRGVGGGSMMGGIAGLGAMGASIAGSAIGGGWGNVLSLGGTGAMIGLQFGGPWGALIGGAIGAGAGLIAMLFGKNNGRKKLKEAALSTYGITVKDKGVLDALYSLGSSMFGKSGVAKNAQAIVSSDEGQLILRNYAEATNQSSEKIDALYIKDPDWKGNQFSSRFGGFRAIGGPVAAGMSYVVGERGPEMFTATQTGTITPNHAIAGDSSTQLMQVLGRLEETIHDWKTRLEGIRPGEVVRLGAEENPEAIQRAYEWNLKTDLRAGERGLRLQGVF